MVRNPTIPTLSDPVLIDRALLEIQTKLLAGLSWLNFAYGKAEKKKRIKDGREIKYPAVYAGGEQYLEVFPDSHIGNFSFFSAYDGEGIDFGQHNIHFDATVGLIFWFDYRSIYPAGYSDKSIDNVKYIILTLFKTMRLQNSAFRVLKVWEEAENIYKEYSDKEIETQFLMRPYGGLRMDLGLKYNYLLRCT